MIEVNKKIILKKGKDDAIKRLHPWIFSGAIDKKINNPTDGDFVLVENSQGKYIAIGYYQDSSIAVKIIDLFPTSTDIVQIIREKILLAINFRKQINLFNNDNTNAFRLINGESDSIPGLIVDYYNGVSVIQPHAKTFRDNIDIIIEVLKDISKTIILKNKEDSSDSKILYGETLIDNQILIKENNLSFYVNPIEGQKTGFFLDQRDNRNFIKSVAGNKSVLNLCCYTGGFSIYSLAGHASKVVSVDSSKNALLLVEKNITVNNLDKSKHISIEADVFDFLSSNDQKFDLVICDPPAFAKHRSAKTQAIKAYRRLNNLALKAVKPNGTLATFSCSGIVDESSFDSAITSSFIDQQRKASVSNRFWQAACHKVSIFHPESRYLKGLYINCD